jgi:hypothetical protein
LERGLIKGEMVMALEVIGAGLGRTGTLSLKLALQQLGLGPCHHMDYVIEHLPDQVPLWASAVKGKADWPTIFSGFKSAVDWPTASFYRELHMAYPQAKFVLTLRSPESWLASFSETIRKLLAARDKLPPPMQDWIAMGDAVLAKAGVTSDLDDAGLLRAFEAHTAAVKASIPAQQLLLFHVKSGWQPLCEFLGLPAPAGDFPRTNDQKEFWSNIPVTV